MRIAIVIGSNSIGGAEKQARELTKQLNSLGHASDIIFLHDKPFSSGPEGSSFGFPTKQFKFPDNQLGSKFFVQLIKLFIFLKKNNYDVIHSFLPESVMLAATYKLLSRKNTVHVAGVRGEYFKKLGLKEKLYIYLIRKSDGVVCNSDSLRKVCILEYGVSPTIISVIPNGVEVGSTKSTLQNNPKRAIVVANYQPYKGYDLLFNALVQVKMPVEIHIVGRGNFKEIFAKEIQKIPAHVKLNFRGELSAQPEFQEFDFAIHPSRTEGMSNAIMEELSNGLPVLAFQVGGNSQLIQNNFNGFLIQELNALELSDRINFLLANPELTGKLSFQAINSMKKYSFTRQAQRHIELYQHLLQTLEII